MKYLHLITLDAVEYKMIHISRRPTENGNYCEMMMSFIGGMCTALPPAASFTSQLPSPFISSVLKLIKCHEPSQVAAVVQYLAQF